MLAPVSKYVARSQYVNSTRRPLSKRIIACVLLAVLRAPSSYISDARVPWIEDLVKVLLSHLFSQRHDELDLERKHIHKKRWEAMVLRFDWQTLGLNASLSGTAVDLDTALFNRQTRTNITRHDSFRPLHKYRCQGGAGEEQQRCFKLR